MKKKLFVLPALFIGLVSCQSNVTYNLDLKVLAPTGAPAVALYSYATEANFETTTNPQTGLIPQFQTGNYDVIVAPTQGGLTQIVKQKAQYKIAATITFGNFYLVSTGTDRDGILNEGDKVVIFQKNDVPGKVFNYLYKDKGLIINDNPSSASDIKTILDNNGLYDGVQYDYVYAAEPFITIANKTLDIDIQEEFSTKSGGKLMTLASVFIKNGSDESKVKAFLNNLKKTINDGISNPSLIQKGIEKLGSISEQQNKFGVSGAIAKKVAEHNDFNLGYKNALSIKDDIEQFVNLITNNALGELSEEVFYQ